MAANSDFVREKWPPPVLCAMISASRDGALLARLLETFGVVAIRGSTSRRGPQALLEATTWMEKNYSVAITPDGPRGPAYKVQEGIIHLAQLTGRPIIPVSNYTRLQNFLPKLGQIPNPAPLCPLRIALGPAGPGPARGHRGPPGATAPRIGAGDDGHHHRLIFYFAGGGDFGTVK